MKLLFIYLVIAFFSSQVLQTLGFQFPDTNSISDDYIELQNLIENCRIIIRSTLFKLKKIRRERNAAADFLAKYGVRNKGQGEKAIITAPDELLAIVNHDNPGPIYQLM